MLGGYGKGRVYGGKERERNRGTEKEREESSEEGGREQVVPLDLKDNVILRMVTESGM